MKVAIISPGIPTKEYPLNGIFAFDQAQALNKAGIDVTFLSIDLRSLRKKREWGFTNGIKDGIKWYNISIPVGPIGWVHRLLSKAIVCYLYRCAFKNNKRPDLIHAHFAAEYAYIINQKYGIPYVITEHSSSINRDDLKKDYVSKIQKYYQHADKVLSVSSALAERVQYYTGVDCLVVPNIIDTGLFLGTKKKKHDGFRMVTTSNLIPLKRTWNILQALSEMQDYNIQLDIIGDGPMKKELCTYAYEKGMDDKVCFHGLLKRDKIAKLYELEDCFILPSSSETFGVAYVEAMAAGLPVIATRCGGPEDFVNDSNGLLIDVDDLAQLKQAILFMYNHYMDYDASRIKEDVTMKFSPEVVANRIKSIYKEILN